MAYNKQQHLTDNIEALRTVFELETSSSLPTEEQRRKLINYSGFGGLSCILLPHDKDEDIITWKKSDTPLFSKVRELYQLLREYSPDETRFNQYRESLRQSVLTSFYTPSPITDVIASSLYEAGIRVGHVLEPSAGIGEFINTFKRFTYDPVHAFENERLAGKILTHLYPDDQIHVQDFETVRADSLPSIDLITSNIPFGNYAVYDPAYSDKKDRVRYQAAQTIHTYFFAKSIDLIREGGLIAFITSQGLMNAPSHESIRHWMVRECNLVSAIRLPHNLFTESANVEVGSDLILLQKNSGKTALSTKEEKFITSRKLSSGIPINNYFMDFERVIHTRAESGTDRYGKPAALFYHGGGVDRIADVLGRMLHQDLHDHIRVELYNSHRESQQKQPDQSLTGGPVLSLYDLMGFSTEERQQVAPRPGINPARMRQVRYEGPMESFYKPDTILFWEEQPGYLRDKRGETFFEPLEVNPDEYDRLKKYIEVRDSYFRLFTYEARYEHENPVIRESLNQAYHSFVRAYGDLNNKENHRILLQDALGREILSLEQFVNGKKELADIFRQPVSFITDTSFQVTNPQETMAASLNMYGYIDLPYMARLSGKTETALQEDLKGDMFYNPLSGNFEIKPRFINGNVLEKAEKLEKYLHEHPDDPHAADILYSIEALKAEIPVPIPYAELDFNFGERWIPPRVYEGFVSELFGTPVRIDFLRDLDQFFIKATDEETVAIKVEYALTSKDGVLYDGLYILQHALLDLRPKIKQTVVDEQGKKRKIPDMEANRVAVGLIVQMREQFLRWLDRQPTATHNELAALYNRIFNSRVKPRFDGNFQTFPGLQLHALGIESPYPHQKDAVWMIINNEGGIVDHDMGGGKSLIMIVGSYELKRLKIANKPLLLCLKTNVMEIAADYRKAYPHANILAPTEKDFEPENRKRLFDRIKNNNWDAVIITFDQYKKIPHSIPLQMELIQLELDSLEENLRVYERLNNRQRTPDMERGLEIRKKNLKTKLSRLQDQLENKKDATVTFEEMGFDHMFVDEFHFFKNLLYTTRHSQVAGLGNPMGSERSFNLLQGVRTIQNKKDGDVGLTGLSGTMIANSLVELYLIFKYFRPRTLEEMGIRTFDAWAAVFARKSIEYEYTVTQELKPKERFRYFIKVPELSHLYAEITDYRSAADLKLDTPRVETELVVCKQYPQQKEFIDNLIRFAQTGNAELVGRKKLTPDEEKALKLIVTDLGRKASFDLRLIDPIKYQDHPENKLSQAAKRIAELYYKFDEYKATQFVFFDIGVHNPHKWNCFAELKRKLVEDYKIPSHEIRAIQEAKNTDERNEMIAEMKLGAIRIMAGGSLNLGTGANAQDWAIAGHHITMVYRPCDLMQPRKRYDRKGNLIAKKNNNTVYQKLYAYERSLDIFMLDLVNIKNTFIEQFKNNSLKLRTLDEGAVSGDGDMNFTEYIARLSGNKQFLELNRLEKMVQVLQEDYNTYRRTTYQRKDKLEESKRELKVSKKKLAGLKADVQGLTSRIPLDPDTGTAGNNLIIRGKTYPTDELRGEALLRINSTVDTKGKFQKIGSLYDFSIQVKSEYYPTRINRFYIEGNEKYCYNKGILPTNPVRAAQSFLHIAEQLQQVIPVYERKIEKLETSVGELTKLVGTPFSKEKELIGLKTRLENLKNEIEHSLKSSQMPTSVPAQKSHSKPAGKEKRDSLSAKKQQHKRK